MTNEVFSREDPYQGEVINFWNFAVIIWDHWSFNSINALNNKTISCCWAAWQCLSYSLSCTSQLFFFSWALHHRLYLILVHSFRIWERSLQKLPKMEMSKKNDQPFLLPFLLSSRVWFVHVGPGLEHIVILIGFVPPLFSSFMPSCSNTVVLSRFSSQRPSFKTILDQLQEFHPPVIPGYTLRLFWYLEV